jgi:hypothetical protein
MFMTQAIPYKKTAVMIEATQPLNLRPASARTMGLTSRLF